ncbi:hypothetical protein LTS18_001634, partial [Coniosporium uncinatum]
MLKQGNGLLSILDDQMRRGKTDLQFLEACKKRFDGRNPAIVCGSTTTTLPGSNFQTRNAAASFTVRHFAGQVEYPVEGLLESNADLVSGDMMNLIKATRSDFVRELFDCEALNAITHPQERTAIVQASVSSQPMRKPTVSRRKGAGRPERADTTKLFDADDDTMSVAASGITSRGRRANDSDKPQGAAAQFLSSLLNITKSLNAPNTNSYFVFCLKPNDRRIANQFDSKCVRTQLQTF